MSNRRAQSLPPHILDEKPERGRCIAAICFSWKVITCIVSHVTLILLVVSYCVGGAYLFQRLERPHEIEIKKGIQAMRQNITDQVWDFSNHELYLSEVDWIKQVSQYLKNFESQILTAMKKEGWDGDEDQSKYQWSFSGSLFYSIIVITTIGYGHISPRTDWGKVATIFYAIVGIPLMLLCLSNIGDVMATSFRFIYWRVCCYICTRKSQRPRHRSRQRSIRMHRYSSRSQPPPMRRSMRLTQRSAADSGLGPSVGLPHAYSDPELRNVGEYDRNYRQGRGAHRVLGGSGKRNQHMSQPISRGGRHAPCEGEYYNEEGMNYTQTLNRASRHSSRQRNHDRMNNRHTIEREGHFNRPNRRSGSMEEINALPPQMKRTLSSRSMRSPNLRRDEISREVRETREQSKNDSHHTPRGRSVPNTARSRAKSATASPNYEDVNEEIVRKTPIISNRYAIEELDHHNQRPKNSMRSQSMPRAAHHKNNYSDGFERSNGNHKRLQRHQLPNHPHENRQNSAHQSSRFGNHLELPEFTSPHMSHLKRRTRSQRPDEYDEDFEECFPDENDGDVAHSDHSSYQRRQVERKHRRERPERLPPSPRIMSPMGFAVKRQVRRRPSPNYDYDEDSMYGDEWSDYFGDIPPKDRPVPIWLCVFLVISYILGGAALFAHWENWTYLDSAYFCFITLTTIGFGDFVPAKGVRDNSEQSIAYCSLYLLFGIALLAMSFNLVQEEFIANVKEVARRLGILKDEDDD